MSIPAISPALEHRRPFASSRPRDCLYRGSIDRENVVPIDAVARESVSLRAIRKPLERRLQSQGHRFSPVVILANVNDRQFVHAGKVQRFVKSANARCPVAKERHYQRILLKPLQSESHASSDGQLPSDTASRGDHIQFGIAHVRWGRASSVRAGSPGEKLRIAELQWRAL